MLGGSPATLRFFTADLMADSGWADAMAGCSHVAHVASPFSTQPPRHEDDLIVPAREGVLRALRHAHAAGVRRFAQTSSVAAVAYGHGKGQHLFTETDWTDLSGPDVYAYVKSKTVAERAAREWVAVQGGAMEFVSVNPSVVLGPVWGADISPSIEVVKQLLSGAIPGCPDLGFGLVDVRDVTDLHIRALTTPGLANERFIASGPFLKIVEIAHILKSGMGHHGRKVPIRQLPDWLVRTVALVNPMLRQVTGELGNVRAASSDRASQRLGWQMRPVEQTILDCARSLIDRGVVKI